METSFFPNSRNQGVTDGEDGGDEAHLEAEGFLERERRWMEGIFAASRPDDLRCGGAAEEKTHR